jgi:hypothetical protein
MLAFAKDITKNDHIHPDESKDSKLKEYMDYQRGINHEMLVYHSLDHAKKILQRAMDEDKEAGKIKAYLESAFPISHMFVDSDKVLLMLRKLINGHNSTNNWYRMNSFYQAIVYDCVECFCTIYNRLLKEAPDKAENYGVSRNTEIDFEDWVQLHFFNLDFLFGRKTQYTHFMFNRRNQTIEKTLTDLMKNGSSKDEALHSIKEDFGIEEDVIKAISNQPITDKELELFYTSVENPIYEYLYEADPTGLNEDDTLIDHSYFLGCQFKGLSYEEALTTMASFQSSQKNVN